MTSTHKPILMVIAGPNGSGKTTITSRLLKSEWPDEAGLQKLKDRMTKLNMSARAFDRILRVTRTIADLESASNGLPIDQAITAPVEARHIAEAIGYRALDRPSNFGVAY